MSEAERSGGIYLDTSALGRVLLAEPDRGAVLATLEKVELHVASALLRVELMRLAFRSGSVELAEELLSGVALMPITEATLSAAETVTPTGVATLDAIHLVTALDLQREGILDSIVTYDRQLADGAEANGLRVLAPGLGDPLSPPA